MTIPREASIVSAIGKYLNTLPKCWWFKVHSNGVQSPGIPDIVGCYRGRFFFLEVKRPNTTTTPLQDRVIGIIGTAGGYGAVVRSVDEARAVMEALKRQVQSPAGAVENA